MDAEQRIDRKALRVLWTTMAAIYGRAWLDVFGDSESIAARAWGRTLADLTREQLTSGLQACAKSADPAPPSLPEFRARCLSIPSLAQVKLELRANAPRSLFTHLVWQVLDRSAFAKARGTAADRLLREAYDLARAQRLRGEHVGDQAPPAPRLVLAPPAQRAVIVERARCAAGLPSGAAP